MGARRLVVLLVMLVAIVGLIVWLRWPRSDTATVRTAGDASVARVPNAPALPSAGSAQVGSGEAGAGEAGSAEGGVVEAPPVSVQFGSDPDPIGSGTGTVIGRVELDGKPVTGFAILMTKHPNVHPMQQPHMVHDANGQFRIERVGDGKWNLFIGAPGIARKLVPAVEVMPGKVTDLGTIACDDGITVRGHVLDGSSRPIAGATVGVVTGGMSPFTITTADGKVLSKPTPESEAIHGRVSTTTDEHGAYVLSGILPEVESRRVSLEATHPDHEGRATSRPLPDEDATIDLVIGSTSRIEGRVVGTKTMVSAAADHVHTVGTGDDGSFAIDKLAPGDYDVWVRSFFRMPIWAPRVVSVPVNKPASIVFDAFEGVTLEVANCQRSLCARDDFMTRIASGLCRDGAQVFERIEPGKYWLCEVKNNSHCDPLVVRKSPAVQKVP